MTSRECELVRRGAKDSLHLYRTKDYVELNSYRNQRICGRPGLGGEGDTFQNILHQIRGGGSHCTVTGCGDEGKRYLGSPSLPPKNCVTSPGSLPSPAGSFLLYRTGRTLPTPCCPWGCREHPMCVQDSGVLCGTSQLQLHVTPGPKLKHWGERKKPDVGQQS